MTRIVYLHRSEIDAAPLTDDQRARILTNEHYGIYNAPRPMYGPISWEGPFNHGVYYVAVDSAQMASAAVNLDGWPVHIVDDADIRRLVSVEIESVIRTEQLATESEMAARLRTVGSDLWIWYRENLGLPPLADA